jgi:YVTN family beta-propeller protein
MRNTHRLLSLLCFALIGALSAHAQNVTASVHVGTGPKSVALNPVTNRIYVANYNSNNVTVIDGATNTTLITVATGAGPSQVAVNSVTNKIYVANYLSNNVTVINGANNSAATVAAGSSPGGVAVNSATNKIYVTNYNGGSVTVIDGATNSTVTVPAGNGPGGVAVNPATNKICVTNYFSNNVTVIDGVTNSTVTVAAGDAPGGVAVNSVTNKIYVTNFYSNTVTVIGGVSNSTVSVATGSNPGAVAVNPGTNKIYVAGGNGSPLSGQVTVIDGVTNTSTTVGEGSNPGAIAVNPTTNEIYVTTNSGGEAYGLLAIDGSSNSTATVTLGTLTASESTFQSLAANPATNKIYVTSPSDNTVKVVDGAASAPTPTPMISLVANAEGESPIIAPNTWVEIKGANLAPPNDTRIWQRSDFVNSQMPTQLDGVSATVNGNNAYVWYISPTQVNILTPPDAMQGSVNIVLNNGAASASFKAQAQPLSPSFFVFDGVHVVGEHLDGSDIGPATLYPGQHAGAAGRRGGSFRQRLRPDFDAGDLRISLAVGKPGFLPCDHDRQHHGPGFLRGPGGAG